MTTLLKRGDPITLLATGEHVRVMVAGKNHFRVTGHVSPYYVGDEGRTWARGHVEKQQAATGGERIEP